MVVPEQIDDRKFETFGAMDRHDPHRVVVGFGEHGFDDPCSFGALEGRPGQVVAQRAACGIAERAGLVDDEADPPCDIAEPARVGPDLEDVPFTHDPFEQLARRHPRAFGVERSKVGDRVRDRVAGRKRLGRRGAYVPPAAVLDVILEQVVVAAAEDRRTQCAHQRELVAGIIDRAQRCEEVANFPRSVDQ